MSLLMPLGLVALAVPVAIYAIHWLFGSRKRYVIPALFLWTDLPRASSGRRRRRIPPFSALLLLQLLAATLGVAALARPTVPGQPLRHIALILDAAASMQATDITPSRFDAARQAVVDRLNSLSPNDEVSLIRAGQHAELLASGPPDSIKPALANAIPDRTAATIGEALALAATRLNATPDRQPAIVLFTDGAGKAAVPSSVGPLPANVEIVPTGGGSNNQAVAALVVRLDPAGQGQTAFIELANESDQPAVVPLQLSADGAPLDARQVSIGARSLADLSLPLPADAHHVSVQLLSHDALALDDEIDVIAPGGPPREVELLGRASDALQRAIESVPSLRIRTADKAQPADLTVLVGVLPPNLPPGPLLLVDPPADSARLLGVGLGSAARVNPDDPLLEGIDLAALRDATPSISGLPPWAHVALGTEQGPLLMHGLLEGHPVVSLTFDPALSGVDKSLAFPLLISNATAYLLSQTDATLLSTSQEPLDPAESDIRPRALPTFDAPAPSSAQAVTEIWPWLAAAALVALGAEWLVFARRG